MRGAVSVVLAMGLLGACKCTKKPVDATELVKQATVSVRTAQATGSSFVIQDEGDDQYLLTNQHVVEGVPLAGSVDVTYFPGSPQEWSGKGSVVATDSFRDLALLRVQAPARRPTPLSGSTEAPRELQPVIIAGFPFGDRLSVTDKGAAVSLSRASISAVRRGALGAVEVLQLDNNVNPGNSGGPVVNEQGAVVGITVAAVRGAGIAFVIPWEQAEALLQGRAFEPRLSVPDCADSCNARVEVTVVDPFRKTRRLELRMIEADDQFLRADRGGTFAAEGELLATASRPASGAFTLLATPSVTRSKRYFVQLGFESSSGTQYGTPFELVGAPAPEVRAEARPRPTARPEEERPEEGRPEPREPVRVCWRINQVQEIGTRIRGDLMLVLSENSAEGTVQFEGHPLAQVTAGVSGRRVRMVVRYPNGTVGNYEGLIDDRTGAFTDGISGANTGATASWTGEVVDCGR